MIKLLLLVIALSSAYANEALITKLANTILQTKALPSVKNESAARTVAVLLVKEFHNYVAANNKTSSFAERPFTLADFPCPLTGRSNPRPTKATKLLPGDIDAVASIGDSLAAAMGANAPNIFSIFTEYRGVSFTNGGQEAFPNLITVPAILKLYNPNLKGYSVGNGDETSTNAALNVAVSGATSHEIGPQFDLLLTKMKNIGVASSDWKLINIFIGGNDLCDYCEDTAKFSPDRYQANIRAMLDRIQAGIPNVFVNLIAPPDVTLLGKVTDGFCSVLHDFECTCATDASTSAAQRLYIQKLVELAAEQKYKSQDNFHVSVQPFLADLVLPIGKDGKPDRSYFAPDCFHFSGISHRAASVALWNNMCESGKKLTSWVPGEPLECPDSMYLA